MIPIPRKYSLDHGPWMYHYNVKILLSSQSKLGETLTTDSTNNRQ
jgi:hypothetical protein